MEPRQIIIAPKPKRAALWSNSPGITKLFANDIENLKTINNKVLESLSKELNSEAKEVALRSSDEIEILLKGAMLEKDVIGALEIFINASKHLSSEKAAEWQSHLILQAKDQANKAIQAQQLDKAIILYGNILRVDPKDNKVEKQLKHAKELQAANEKAAEQKRADDRAALLAQQSALAEAEQAARNKQFAEEKAKNEAEEQERKKAAAKEKKEQAKKARKAEKNRERKANKETEKVSRENREKEEKAEALLQEAKENAKKMIQFILNKVHNTVRRVQLTPAIKKVFGIFGHEIYLMGSGATDLLDDKSDLTKDLDFVSPIPPKELLQRYPEYTQRDEYMSDKLIHLTIPGLPKATIFYDPEILKQKFNPGLFHCKSFYVSSEGIVVSASGEQGFSDFDQGIIRNADPESFDQVLTKNPSAAVTAIRSKTKMSATHERSFTLDQEILNAMDHPTAFKPTAMDENKQGKMIDKLLNAFSDATAIENFALLKQNKILQKFLKFPDAILEEKGLPVAIRALAINKRTKVNVWILKFLTQQFSYQISPSDSAVKEYLSLFLEGSPVSRDMAIALTYLHKTCGRHFSKDELEKAKGKDSPQAYTSWVIDFFSTQLNNPILPVPLELQQEFICNLIQRTDRNQLTSWINENISKMQGEMKKFMGDLLVLSKPSDAFFASLPHQTGVEENKHFPSSYTPFAYSNHYLFAPPSQVMMRFPSVQSNFSAPAKRG